MKYSFRNNKAQCALATLFGFLNGKYVCVGSVVLKRKQLLAMDKAEQASGTVVDLPPNLLEGYGLQLLLKRVAEYTSKQFHLAADGDLKVILSPFFVTICVTIFVTILVTIFVTIFCHHFRHRPIKIY